MVVYNCSCVLHSFLVYCRNVFRNNWFPWSLVLVVRELVWMASVRRFLWSVHIVLFNMSSLSCMPITLNRAYWHLKYKLFMSCLHPTSWHVPILFLQVHHTFATAGSDGAFNFWDKDSKQRLKVVSITFIPTIFLVYFW
jgi:WD40 repeat protein